MAGSLAAILGAVGSVAGGIIGSKGADKAAKAQERAAAADIAWQREQLGLADKRNQPFLSAGYEALENYMLAAGLRGDEGNVEALRKFRQNPGYQYNVDQQTRAIENSMANRGKLFSGQTGNAIAERVNYLADQGWGNWKSDLSSIAGMGQSTAVGANNLALGYSGNVSNALNNQGAAQASGAVGSANAWQNALAGIAQSAGNYFGQKQNGLTGGASAIGSIFGARR